jgi:hypothetical protein
MLMVQRSALSLPSHRPSAAKRTRCWSRSRLAKHLACEHLHAVHLALHRAVTPGQGDLGVDGLIVIAAPLRTPLQGVRGLAAARASPVARRAVRWRTAGSATAGKVGRGRRSRVLGLAQALGIVRHGRVAPGSPPPLERSKEAHGVPVPRMPARQKRRVRGREHAAAAIDSALTLGPGLPP